MCYAVFIQVNSLADALFFPKVSLRVAVEDHSQNWCHAIGEPIRGIIYEVLLGDQGTIIEHQRKKGSTDEGYEKSVTAPICRFQGRQILSLPQLSIDIVTAEKSKAILYSALEIEGDNEFKYIESNYKLLLAITRYWYRKSELDQKFKDTFLKSFLLFLQKPLNRPKDPATVMKCDMAATRDAEGFIKVEKKR